MSHVVPAPSRRCSRLTHAQNTPWSARYITKANAWIAIFSFIGNYWRAGDTAQRIRTQLAYALRLQVHALLLPRPEGGLHLLGVQAERRAAMPVLHDARLLHGTPRVCTALTTASNPQLAPRGSSTTR